MPFNPEAKTPGDLIRAEDWNAAMDEVVRLETDKLSRTGTGQVAGGLTLTGSLGVGTATPNRKVTVQDAGNCYLNVRANGGAQEVLIGADAAGGIVSSMTNHDLILRAGSNSEKVRIKVDGKVGIGTDAPDSTLHVRGGAEPVVKIQSNVDGSISARLALRQGNERGADLYFDGRDGDSSSPEAFVIATNGTAGSDAIAADVRLVVELGTGHVGLGRRDPGYPLHLSGGAYCTGTAWTNASSRALKSDIAPLDAGAARTAIAALDPVTFRYREGDGHVRVGFVAEDVPELVAETDRKGLSPMDILAVVTRVVQEQQAEIERLRGRLDALAGPGAA